MVSYPNVKRHRKLKSTPQEHIRWEKSPEVRRWGERLEALLRAELGDGGVLDDFGQKLQRKQESLLEEKVF